MTEHTDERRRKKETSEDFELYVGREIYYFVPDERRSAVEWYMASKLLSDQAKAMADGNRQEKEAVKS